MSLLPEGLVGLAAVTIFLLDVVFRQHAKRLPYLAWFAVGALGVASQLILSGTDDLPSKSLFFHQIVNDRWSTFFRLFAWLATAGGIAMAALSKNIAAERRGEYFALLLCLGVGLSLMAQASDGLMIFISVEWVSLLSYCLAGFGQRGSWSAEASLKYALYGAVASACMVFGISYLYGISGHTQLWSIEFGKVGYGGAGLALCLGWMLFGSGIAFKIAAVPWQMWCPDVYEGSPTPFTAFLSVGPKAAGFALLYRMVCTLKAIPQLPVDLIVGALAAVTMTWANLLALGQIQMKRMLAYSSIAQAGYLLLGVAAGTREGAASVVLYLVIYLFMDLGAFWSVSMIEDALKTDSISDYRGLGRRFPLFSVALTLCLASLAGLPPLGGFVGKFHLFQSLVDRGQPWSNVLAVLAVLNSALSFYYYGRVIRRMFFEQSEAPSMAPATLRVGSQMFLGLCVCGTVGLGVAFEPLRHWAMESSRSLLLK